MNLNIGIIANALPFLTQYVCGQPDHPLVLSDIRSLLPDSGFFSDSILYFAEWPVLRQLKEERPAYAVCIGGGKEAADLFEQLGISGFVLEEKKPTIAFGIIQSVFLRYNQLEYRLLKSQLRRETTQEVLNCCSDIFLNHAILFDTELNLIDYSTNFLPDDSDLIWKETLEKKKRSEKMYSQTKKLNLSHEPTAMPNSEMVDLGAGFQRHMITSFYDSARRVASLVIVENNKPLSPCHLKLLDHVSEIIGSSITDRYATVLGSNESLRALLVAMLNKVGVDPMAIKRCLSLIGWKVKDDFRLLVITFHEDSRNTDTLTRYLYIYENIFPECIAFKYIESLVLVVHNDTHEVINQCVPLLEKQLKAHQAVCGVSFPFNSILQLCPQYLIADTAIQLGEKSTSIRFVKDVITNHLINKIANDTPLIPLCNREAVRIFDYDQENGTELLLTLETYLRQNKSLKAAAEELFIHRSTMTYRLGCIEKLARIDYDDSKERLHVLLTCIVLRNLGKRQLGI